MTPDKVVCLSKVNNSKKFSSQKSTTPIGEAAYKSTTSLTLQKIGLYERVVKK